METVAFILLGLFIGGVIGWLLGSRDGAGAKQAVASLRLQLDEVITLLHFCVCNRRQGEQDQQRLHGDS